MFFPETFFLLHQMTSFYANYTLLFVPFRNYMSMCSKYQFPIDRCLGYFWFFAIANNADITIFADVCKYFCVINCRNEIAGTKDRDNEIFRSCR